MSLLRRAVFLALGSLGLATAPTFGQEASFAPAIRTSDSVLINNNQGGKIREFLVRKHYLTKVKRKAHIYGDCYSACTLYLGMPSDLLCVGDNARFFFHKPRKAGSLEKDKNALTWVLNEYPDWVNDWIESIGGLKNEFIEMPRSIVQKHVEACGDVLQRTQEADYRKELPPPPIDKKRSGFFARLAAAAEPSREISTDSRLPPPRFAASSAMQLNKAPIPQRAPSRPKVGETAPPTGPSVPTAQVKFQSDIKNLSDYDICRFATRVVSGKSVINFRTWETDIRYLRFVDELIARDYDTLSCAILMKDSNLAFSVTPAPSSISSKPKSERKPAPLAPASYTKLSAQPGLGKCHMGYCSWGLIIEDTVLRETRSATLHKLIVLGGTSGEYKTVEEYPKIYSENIIIEWNENTHTLYVFCNLQLPSTFMDGKTNIIDFQNIEYWHISSANLYVEVCYGENPYVWADKNWLKYRGFTEPLHNSLNIEDPSELFGYVE